ncbi:MAG: amino acid permease [Candidatus Eremiobacteraeota bacterium]|nr:amino acid permease [Candidatus Eremiobacteraeota bacterium]
MTLFRRLFARAPLSWTGAEPGAPRLRRALRWPALTAIGLGTMLGGIFPTIGAGAHAAGPAVILAFLLSGLVCACVAVCYAEFASMVPVAGSAYTYAYATLGEAVAWIIGWDLILEYGISAAPVASSWSQYAQSLLASAGVHLPYWAQTANVRATHWQIDVLAALVVLAISALLAIGIRESSRVNGALVVVQIVAMVVFVSAIARFVHPANLHPFAPHGWHGVLTSTALVFFAYIGFDTVTVASEEAHDPARDVPIAILVSLAIGGVLYVAMTWVTVGSTPWRQLSDGAALLDAVKANGNDGWLAAIVGVGGIAGNTTVMLTSLLGQVRIFYVMARDRLLPPSVASVHPRFRTPARMTMITGVLVSVLAAMVPLDALLSLVNIGTLSAFAIVCAGVLVLRIIAPAAPRPFRAPLAPLFTVLGTLSCLFLISGLSVTTWVRFAIWFVAGAIVYAVYGYRHSRLHASTR